MSAPTIRLLYAEDNPQDAELTRMHFAVHAPDFTLTNVDSGARCLEALRGGEFDLLLLDHRLPDTDSLALLPRLAVSHRQLPLVVVTALGDDETAIRVLRLGASDYVAKSDDYLAPLPAMLRELVARARQKHEAGGPAGPVLRRILYVESDELQAKQTQLLLAPAAPHLQFTVVRNGPQALTRLLQPQHGFDLVLTDVRAPGMSGLDFLHATRRHAITLPILLLASPVDEEVALSALRLGAADYVIRRERYQSQLALVIDRVFQQRELEETCRRLRAEVAATGPELEQKVRERTALLRQEIADRKAAEDMLQRSQTQLQAMLDAYPAALFVKDLEGRLVLVNRAFADCYHLDRTQVLGLTDFDLLPEELAAAYREKDLQVLAARQPVEWDEPAPPQAGPRINHTVKFPLLDAAGQPYALCGFATDITARQQAEAGVRQAEAQLRAFFDHATEGIFQSTPDGRLLTANRALARMLGYDSTDALLAAAGHLGPQLYVDPAARTRFLRAMEEHGAVSNFEFQVWRLDGRAIWVSENSRVVRDDAGNLLCFEGTVQDITERRSAEAAMLESEQLYRRLFTSAADGLFVFGLDAAGRPEQFIEVNDAACQLLGWERADLLQKSSLDIEVPDPAVDADELWRRFFTTGTLRAERQLLRRDGTTVPVEIRAQLFEVGGRATVLAIARDITERRQAHAALERQRAELEMILDTVPALIFYKDREHRLARVNAALARCLGRSKEEIAGRTDTELGLPDAEKYIQADEDVMISGQPRLGIVEPLLTPEGTRWLQTDKVPHRDAQGNVTGIIGFARDITEQRAAEELLREQASALQSSEERFRAVVEQAADAFFVHDATGRLLDVNHRACESLGCTRAELLQMNVGDIKTDFVPERARAAWAQLEPGLPATWTGHHRRKDGSSFPVEIRVGAVAVGGQRLFLALARDVTERQQAEAERARLAATIEATSDFVALATAGHQLLYLNQAARRALGLRADEDITGTELAALHPAWVAQRLVTESFPTAIRAGTWSGEAAWLTRDGREIPVSQVVLAHKSAAGEVEFLSLLARDITERKRAETRSRAFASLGQRLSSTLTQHEAAAVIVDTADTLFGWDSCLVTALEKDPHHVQHLLAMDLIASRRTSLPPEPAPVGITPLFRQVLKKGARLILREPGEAEPGAEAKPFGDTARRSASLLFAPIRHGRRVIGLLTIQSYQPHAYTQRDLEVFQSLADFCGGALERIRTEAVLKQTGK